MEDKIIKYPRTPHLEGSRLQSGDDIPCVKLKDLVGHYIVQEIKVDGGQAGISFNENANLLLQSRGHFLNGGPRERHFNLFKTWCNRHIDVLFDILQDRYVMYGEWLYALHSLYYDRLPHYFLEFDIYDKTNKYFLSTSERKKIIGKAPIVSVPIVWEGIIESIDHFNFEVRPSLYKSQNWQESLIQTAKERNIDSDKILKSIDTSDLDEGFYYKDELEEKVIGRYKWVRNNFTQIIIDSGTHWLDRPILPNQLAPGVDIFSKIKC